MDARNVIITGANSGIGFEASRALAQRGMHVVMVCRNRQLGQSALREVAAVATGPAPELFIADLSSQREVRNVALEIREHHSQIDVLVNNAGGIFAPKAFSEDGIEKTFVINHLSPFLLTNLLLDLLEAAPSGRIVNVVTEVYPGKLDFNNLQGERRYNFFFAYMHSKLANIISSFELARRRGGSAVTVNCISPGPTVTKFGAAELHGLPSLMPKIMMRLPIFAPADTGARGVIALASSPQFAGVSGRFYLREREIRAKPVTRDLNVARRLWGISEQMTGLTSARSERSA